MSIGKRMRELLEREGTKLVSRAAQAVMNDPRGQEAVAAAVGAAQNAKEAFDDAQEQLLVALGYAPRPDYAALLKKAATLKRKARELDEKLGGLLD